jgi:hypothetical protein
MFAIIAAVIFAIAFILDLLGKSSGNLFTNSTLIALGLFFLALHFAPLSGVTSRRRR